MKTLLSGFLGLGLLVLGCGSDPAADATPAPDAGADALMAADGQAGGTGGATADGGATGGAGGQVTGTGGAGGAGGVVGTGGAAGAGTGGVVGTGGVSGTGGAVAGTGGATGTGGTGTGGAGGATAIAVCTTPDGLPIGGLTCTFATPVPGRQAPQKNGHFCAVDCSSHKPDGTPVNYAGPPFHVECITPPDSSLVTICVSSCSECS